MLRKTVLVMSLVAACAAGSSVASATTYPATLVLSYGTIERTYNVDVDCIDGNYQGTGTWVDSATGDSGSDRVNGGPLPWALGGAWVSQDSTTGIPTHTFQLWPADEGTTTRRLYVYLNATGAPLVGQGTGTFTPAAGNYCRAFPEVTSADDCKKDGWKGVSSTDDVPFKNPGDCVSYIQKKKK